MTWPIKKANTYANTYAMRHSGSMTYTLEAEYALIINFITAVMVIADWPYQPHQASPHHYGVDYNDNHSQGFQWRNGECSSSSAMEPAMITVIINYDLQH